MEANAVETQQHDPTADPNDGGALLVSPINVTFSGTPAGDALDGTYTLSRVPGGSDADDPVSGYAAIVCGFLVISAALREDGWEVSASYPERGAWLFRTKARAGDVTGGTVEGIEGGTAAINSWLP